MFELATFFKSIVRVDPNRFVQHSLPENKIADKKSSARPPRSVRRRPPKHDSRNCLQGKQVFEKCEQQANEISLMVR